VKYDITLKELLFRQIPNTLLSRVLRKPVKVKRALPTELPYVRGRRADLLFELDDGQILHIELQNNRDKRFGHRMLEYRLRIQEKFGRIPIQVALWIAAAPASLPHGVEEDLLTYRFHLVELRTVDAEPLLASHRIEENLLAILCRVPDSKQAIRRILRHIAALPEPEQRDQLQKLLILSGLRGLEADVEKETRIMPVIMNIHNNSYLRLVHDRAVAEGMEKGLEKGLQKGLQKGQKALKSRDASQRKVLQTMIRRRFGKLPKYASEKIKSAPAEQLDQWTLRILDAPTVRDIFA